MNTCSLSCRLNNKNGGRVRVLCVTRMTREYFTVTRFVLELAVNN